MINFFDQSFVDLCGLPVIRFVKVVKLVYCFVIYLCIHWSRVYALCSTRYAYNTVQYNKTLRAIIVQVYLELLVWLCCVHSSKCSSWLCECFTHCNVVVVLVDFSNWSEWHSARLQG